MIRRILYILNNKELYAGGPGRPRNPVWVSYLLLSVNVLVFIAMSFAGGSTNSEVLIDFGAMYGPYLGAGQPWRLVTAMFIHVGIFHLAFNSIGLWIFGRMAETLFGPSKFVLIYVLAGLCGAVVSYIFNPIAIAAGASGAIFGVLGALAAFFLTMYKDPNARKNLYGLLGLAALNLIFGFLSEGVDNWAHMGGFLAGFFLGYFLTPVSGLLHPGFEGFYVINKLKNRFTRYAAILIIGVAILGGFWLGNATLPMNTTTEVLKAESLLKEGDYTGALENVEKAIEVGTSGDAFFGRAYFLRALIMVQYGDLEAALTDIGYALVNADSETRRKSIQLLTEINDLR